MIPVTEHPSFRGRVAHSAAWQTSRPIGWIENAGKQSKRRTIQSGIADYYSIEPKSAGTQARSDVDLSVAYKEGYQKEDEKAAPLPVAVDQKRGRNW